MRESFVVHAEYIEDLPEEFKLTYLQYIYDYGIFDKEPVNLTGFELSIWIKIKRRIDQDRTAYEERKEKNKKRQEEWRRKQKALEEPTTEVVAEETDTDSVPPIMTPSQTEFSNIIFKIFSDAGLPCNKNNSISFLQSDFYNAISFIHNSPVLKHVHSEDVIQACKNYVEVLNDDSCYISTRMSFFKLVQSKLFYDFLPANFTKENYKSFNKQNKTASTTSEKKWFEETPCPSCKSKKVYWSNASNLYKCEACNRTFKIGEI